MTESLLNPDWLSELASYQTLYLGFSGGLDSSALLHNLVMQQELKDKLCAVHIHHGLSRNADDWQVHCEQFCSMLAIPLIVRSVEFSREANIEENAREARYQVFSQLLKENDCLLLAHHCDDQAETVLLQLLRGTGVDGLAAMVPIKTFAKGKLARPFLHHTRQALTDYAQSHDLTWIEDESNQNNAFSRNYLRQQVMPLLQQKWPGAVANLVRTAHHCQQAKLNLEDLAYLDCPELRLKKNTLSVSLLQQLSHARLSNVLRFWLRKHGIQLPTTRVFNRLIAEVVFASIDAQPCVAWGDVKIRRYQQTLYLHNQPVVSNSYELEWNHFPQTIFLNGIGSLDVSSASQGLQVPIGSQIQIRFRQGGELFSWHGQTKQLKKLFQQWQIPPWLRDQIPLIYINDHLAAVVDYAISDRFYGENSSHTYQISLQPSCS